MAVIDKYFELQMIAGGSDLHLAEGQPPKSRIHGELIPLEDEILSREKMISMMEEICLPKRWDKFLKIGDMDFAYAYEDKARFRSNYYMHEHGVGCIFRIIPTKILTLEDLNLPDTLKTFSKLRSGMVLVTGPTGSGKSTTLAAIIDYVNSNYQKKILTIEEPIEFVHQNKKSIIIQREVGVDCNSFAEALIASTRQDVDVILVGEMRDPETVALALSAAEMGLLVFGTLHTNSAANTINRIIDTFPHDQQGQARMMLSGSLKGVVSQLLVKKKDHSGRKAVNEILLDSPGLGNLIREGKVSQIKGLMQQGKLRGMQLMDDVLKDLCKKNVISANEAYMKANDKSNFETLIEEETSETLESLKDQETEEVNAEDQEENSIVPDGSL